MQGCALCGSVFQKAAVVLRGVGGTLECTPQCDLALVLVGARGCFRPNPAAPTRRPALHFAAWGCLSGDLALVILHRTLRRTALIRPRTVCRNSSKLILPLWSASKQAKSVATCRRDWTIVDSTALYRVAARACIEPKWHSPCKIPDQTGPP